MKAFFLLVLLAALLISGVPVHADISPLSPGEEAADLVLERADWSGFAPLSLEELLRHFAGVTIARRGGVGSPLFVNVLGSISGQVQVVLDGLEMNEVDQNWSRLFGIPVSHIDRILLYRTSDPVRIEIWTRESQQDKPITDVDLGRGDFTTRSRRIRFATPERPVQAVVNYEELLRATQDFRVDQSVPVTDGLGSYAGRGRWIDGLLIRPNTDKVRFRYYDFVDDSNGSYDSQTDRAHTRRALAGVRWSTSLRGRSLELDLANIAWGRSQQLQSVTTDWTESRSTVAADIGLLTGQHLEAQARLRAATLSTIEDPGASAQLTRTRQWDVGLYVATRSRLRWQFWGAYHDNQRQGESWSGRARLSWRARVWNFSADAGRGVSFAGNRETLLPGASPRRIGRYASAGVERGGQKISVGARAWAKDFDGRSSATQERFPLLGSGPTRVGGMVAQGQWNASHGNWLFGLGVQLSWVPWVEGDRGGLPDVQTELLARLARLDWFDGDLSVTTQAVWHAETQRQFTTQTVLGDYHVAGFDFNVRFLRRIVLFWHIENAFDIRYETHPNVLMEQIRSHFGLQVLFFN